MSRLRSGLTTHVASHLALLLLLLPAVWISLAAVADLPWPADQDFFRDIAQAQVFADGRWGADAFYQAERLHYPPLAPAIVAALSKLTAVPIPRLYVLAGLWLNLLGPVALYALLFRLIGPGGALVSLFSFLYLRTGPAYLLGGYTPWFFASAFAQGLCFASLLLVMWALDRPSTGRDLAAGGMIGLTFLAHLAPALLLACVVPGLLLLELPWRTALRRLSVLGLGAALVAWPHLLSLLGHYHLRFLNREPGQWTTGFDAHWPDLYQGGSLLGLVGVLVLVACHRHGRAARLLALWTAAAALLLLASARTHFMVAPHHFLIYTRTAFDIGLGWLIALLLDRLPLRGHVRGALAVALMSVTLILIWPDYRRSTALGHDRRHALLRAARTNQIALYHWLRANTNPEDVILAGQRISFETIGPAGRGVLAVPSEWANPFVDNEGRREDRDSLIAALRQSDWQTFCPLAERYHVTHVLRTASDHTWALPAPHFQLRYKKNLEVYSWQTCPEPLPGHAAGSRSAEAPAISLYTPPRLARVVGLRLGPHQHVLQMNRHANQIPSVCPTDVVARNTDEDLHDEGIQLGNGVPSLAGLDEATDLLEVGQIGPLD